MALGPDADDADLDGRILAEVHPTQIHGPAGLKAPLAQRPRTLSALHVDVLRQVD